MPQYGLSPCSFSALVQDETGARNLRKAMMGGSAAQSSPCSTAVQRRCFARTDRRGLGKQDISSQSLKSNVLCLHRQYTSPHCNSSALLTWQSSRWLPMPFFFHIMSLVVITVPPPTQCNSYLVISTSFVGQLVCKSDLSMTIQWLVFSISAFYFVLDLESLSGHLQLLHTHDFSTSALW